jgi:hypothetical protein
MENTVTISLKNLPKARICTSCIICEESIPLTEWEESALSYGHHIHSKVCDKCKAAILYMREQMP